MPPWFAPRCIPLERQRTGPKREADRNKMRCIFLERQQEELHMKTTSNHVRRLTKLALLIAIELVMRAIGLGAVPVGQIGRAHV